MNIGFTTPGHERIGGGPVAGILLDDVCRDFGEKQAVSHVTLEINKGEFFSLLGPSGCGKTTTLRMLSGLEFPTSGSITLDNEKSPIPPPISAACIPFFRIMPFSRI